MAQPLKHRQSDVTDRQDRTDNGLIAYGRPKTMFSELAGGATLPITNMSITAVINRAHQFGR